MTLLNFLLRGWSLEKNTEPGGVNSLLIVATAVVVIAVGIAKVPELIIGIWVEKYDPNFPLIPIVGILMGGGLICVFLLVLIEPMLQTRRERRDD